MKTIRPLLFLTSFTLLLSSTLFGKTPWPLDNPIICCKDYEEIKKLDGQVVHVVGVYEQTVLSKSEEKRKKYLKNLKPPGIVNIVLPNEITLMLEVYYRSEGTRPIREIQKFNGKKVEVIGTLHAHTPTQYSSGGVPMQTMIGPYLGEIVSIKEIN